MKQETNQFEKLAIEMDNLKLEFIKSLKLYELMYKLVSIINKAEEKLNNIKRRIKCE